MEHSSPASSAANNVANNITPMPPAINSITVGGGPATLSGNITGPGGFRKGSKRYFILTGANNYAGTTTVDSGFLNFGKTQSLYNGNTANWTSSFLTVLCALAIFAVGGGGVGEFTMADFNYFASGAGSSAFLDGSSVGMDTTNSGDQTISTVFTKMLYGIRARQGWHEHAIPHGGEHARRPHDRAGRDAQSLGSTCRAKQHADDVRGSC